MANRYSMLNIIPANNRQCMHNFKMYYTRYVNWFGCHCLFAFVTEWTEINRSNMHSISMKLVAQCVCCVLFFFLWYSHSELMRILDYNRNHLESVYANWHQHHRPIYLIKMFIVLNMRTYCDTRQFCHSTSKTYSVRLMAKKQSTIRSILTSVVVSHAYVCVNT